MTAHRNIVAIVSAGALLCVAPLAGATDAATEVRCTDYAQRAVQQFRSMRATPQCRIQSDARWQFDFAYHYKSCIEYPAAFANSEESARDKFLRKCGAMPPEVPPPVAPPSQ